MRELLLHDMRTPLATISGYAQLLQRRAAKRVEQLLDALARLPLDDDVDHVQPRRTAVDLVALAARMSTYTYAPGRQRITVLPSVPELIGWWDCTRLEHVLMNLFSNALKYSPKDRDVLVTVQRSSDCAVLRVADQGVGILPAEVCRIYEPSYRASKRSRPIPWHRYRGWQALIRSSPNPTAASRWRASSALARPLRSACLSVPKRRCDECPPRCACAP